MRSSSRLTRPWVYAVATYLTNIYLISIHKLFGRFSQFEPKSIARHFSLLGRTITSNNSITMAFLFSLRMSALGFRPYIRHYAYRFHQLSTSHQDAIHNCKTNTNCNKKGPHVNHNHERTYHNRRKQSATKRLQSQPKQKRQLSITG